MVAFICLKSWVAFQIKESPEGDWNFSHQSGLGAWVSNFQIKESPEGDWNTWERIVFLRKIYFQIKESPEGDWNRDLGEGKYRPPMPSFKLKNPRKGTETVIVIGYLPRNI